MFSSLQGLGTGDDYCTIESRAKKRKSKGVLISNLRVYNISKYSDFFSPIPHQPNPYLKLETRGGIVGKTKFHFMSKFPYFSEAFFIPLHENEENELTFHLVHRSFKPKKLGFGDKPLGFVDVNFEEFFSQTLRENQDYKKEFIPLNKNYRNLKPVLSFKAKVVDFGVERNKKKKKKPQIKYKTFWEDDGTKNVIPIFEKKIPEIKFLNKKSHWIDPNPQKEEKKKSELESLYSREKKPEIKFLNSKSHWIDPNPQKEKKKSSWKPYEPKFKRVEPKIIMAITEEEKERVEEATKGILTLRYIFQNNRLLQKLCTKKIHEEKQKYERILRMYVGEDWKFDPEFVNGSISPSVTEMRNIEEKFGKEKETFPIPEVPDFEEITISNEEERIVKEMSEIYPQQKENIKKNINSVLQKQKNGFTDENRNEIIEIQKKYEEMVDATLCIVCMDKPKIIAFDCMHLCACDECSKKLNACPLCRKDITQRMKIFL